MGLGKYVNYPRIEDVRGVLDRGRGNRRLRPEGVIYNVARLLDSSHPPQPMHTASKLLRGSTDVYCLGACSRGINLPIPAANNWMLG
jgi:hypothetical protein